MTRAVFRRTRDVTRYRSSLQLARQSRLAYDRRARELGLVHGSPTWRAWQADRLHIDWRADAVEIRESVPESRQLTPKYRFLWHTFARSW